MLCASNAKVHGSQGVVDVDANDAKRFLAFWDGRDAAPLVARDELVASVCPQVLIPPR